MQAIRDHSVILMGKNTMMRRSIRLYCERTGNDQWLQLLDHMVGNVGILFTKGDLNEVRGNRGGSKMGCCFSRTHEEGGCSKPAHCPLHQRRQPRSSCLCPAHHPPAWSGPLPLLPGRSAR